MRKIRFPALRTRNARALLRRELLGALFLLSYTWSILSTLFPQPAIPLLVGGFLQMLIFLVLWDQGMLLVKIWKKRPSDLPPTFSWSTLAEGCLLLLGPYVLMAITLLLSGYRL